MKAKKPRDFRNTQWVSIVTVNVVKYWMHEMWSISTHFNVTFYIFCVYFVT